MAGRSMVETSAHQRSSVRAGVPSVLEVSQLKGAGHRRCQFCAGARRNPRRCRAGRTRPVEPLQGIGRPFSVAARHDRHRRRAGRDPFAARRSPARLGAGARGAQDRRPVQRSQHSGQHFASRHRPSEPAPFPQRGGRTTPGGKVTPMVNLPQALSAPEHQRLVRRQPAEGHPRPRHFCPGPAAFSCSIRRVASTSGPSRTSTR